MEWNGIESRNIDQSSYSIADMIRFDSICHENRIFITISKKESDTKDTNKQTNRQIGTLFFVTVIVAVAAVLIQCIS